MMNKNNVKLKPRRCGALHRASRTAPDSFSCQRASHDPANVCRLVGLLAMRTLTLRALLLQKCRNEIS